MTRDDVNAWQETALSVLRALGHDFGSAPEGMVSRYFREQADAIEGAPTWPVASKRELTRMLLHDFLGDKPRRVTEADRSVAAKAVLLAHAATHGDLATVAPHEREELADAVDGHLEAEEDARLRGLSARLRSVPPAQRKSVATTGGVIVSEFAVRWCPRGARAAGAFAHASHTFAMTVVAPEDAPVVARLRRPGGWLDVRRHGATWIRPVLAPGSWEPCGVDAFVEAAREGVPWNDDPFVPAPRGRMATFGIRDHAEAGAPSNPGDARRFAAAAEDALRRAGPLTVVDGVVHRETSEPRLAYARQDKMTGLTWCLPGDLSGVASLGTLEPDDRGIRFPHTWTGRPPGTAAYGLPLAALADVCAAFEACERAATDGALARSKPHETGFREECVTRIDKVLKASASSADGLCEVVDSDAFQHEPMPLVRHLAQMMADRLGHIEALPDPDVVVAGQRHWLRDGLDGLKAALAACRDGDLDGAVAKVTEVDARRGDTPDYDLAPLMRMAAWEARRIAQGLAATDPELEGLRF